MIAGVDFFSAGRLVDQEPTREQRECLMVVPAQPTADFVVAQTDFALAALQTFLDAMLRFGHARELRQRHLGRSVRQVVIHFDHLLLVAVAVTNHHQRLARAFLMLLRAGRHAAA